jgi:hypothetical protein
MGNCGNRRAVLKLFKLRILIAHTNANINMPSFDTLIEQGTVKVVWVWSVPNINCSVSETSTVLPDA